MEDVSELRITGIDETRPPRVRKEPYIDFYLKLSHQAPPEWCELFNGLGRKLNPPAKIDKTKGRVIDAYVRDMNQMQPCLDRLKGKVAECNALYAELLAQRASAAALRAANPDYDEGEQGRLNRIVAGLKF